MPSFHRWRAFWRTTSALDRAAAIVFILFVLSWTTPLGRYLSFLGAWRVILFVIAAGYLMVRLLRWARKRLLWGLRNRLVVAYIFIAVVPVVLLLAMVALSGYLLYFQLGAHLLQDDLSERVTEVSHIAETLDETIENDVAKGLAVNSRAVLGRHGIAAMLAAAGKRLPGLEVHLPESAAAIGSNARPVPGFTGLVQSSGNLWIEAVVASQAPSHEGELYVRVPVTAALLGAVAPDLGPIQLTTFRPAVASDPVAEVLNLSGRRLVGAGGRERPPSPAEARLVRHGNLRRLHTQCHAAQSRRADHRHDACCRRILTATLGTDQSPIRLSRSLGDPLVIILILIGVFFSFSKSPRWRQVLCSRAPSPSPSTIFTKPRDTYVRAISAIAFMCASAINSESSRNHSMQ